MPPSVGRSSGEITVCVSPSARLAYFLLFICSTQVHFKPCVWLCVICAFLSPHFLIIFNKFKSQLADFQPLFCNA